MVRNTNNRGFSLKDELFNKTKIAQLGARFESVYAGFSNAQFVKTVMKQLPSLALKQRIVCIADALAAQLPVDFEAACAVVIKALPEPLDPSKTDDDFGDFIYAPLGHYVATRGVSKEQLTCSLSTLREITMRFSMEDAIRPFLNEFPKETLHIMQYWALDEHYHVRRLVSEGTRPLLPWSSRIGVGQKDTLPLLDMLHADKTRYVTRSVANHLNDISKSDPALVIETLGRWRREGKQQSDELAWITRHALRTLVKQGNSDAFALLGYRPKPAITVTELSLADNEVVVGEALSFSFTIEASQNESLMVDYVVTFVKAGGKTAEKVYKIKKMTLAKGEKIDLSKHHRFVEGATTLTFYEGVHAVALQINGVRYQPVQFNLKERRVV